MKPRRRPFHLRDSTLDDLPQLIWTLERLHPKKRPPQLEARVRVRPNRGADSVSAGKFLRFGIKPPEHTARVKRLNGVHEGENLQQVGQVPAPFPQPVEWMRNADKCPLPAQSADRFLRRKPGGNLLGHIRGENFPARRHNLLADDDPFGIYLLRFERARDGVVVGDDDAVNALFARGPHKVRGRRERVLRCAGVAVKFDGNSVGQSVIRYLTGLFSAVYTGFTGYAKKFDLGGGKENAP